MKLKKIKTFITFCFILPFVFSLYINIASALANTSEITPPTFIASINIGPGTSTPSATIQETPTPFPTPNIIDLNTPEVMNTPSIDATVQPPETLHDCNINVKVYNKTLDTVMDMNLHDYTICAVAGEMPATFELEALKAQAVAARTYTLSHLKSGLGHNNAAHVCTYYGCCQAYVSIDQMKKNWGTNFEEKYDKIKKAVEETDGLVMLYNNCPITVFYFSTSNGYTDACQDVFTKNLPYYKCVESPGEETAPNFYSFVKVGYNEMLYTLSTKLSVNITKEELINSTSISRTAGGRVAKINFNGQTVKGTQIRTSFGLRSADFYLSFNDDFVLIEVYGNGHGVGMSQLGANYMAQNSKTFKEILLHYYINVSIETIII